MDKTDLRSLIADDLRDGKTIVDMWEACVARFPNNIAFNLFGNETTYETAGKYVNNLALSLLELGVEPGDNVAVILPSCPQYTIADYAIKSAGAVTSGFDPRETEEKLRARLEDIDAVAVIALDMLYTQEGVRNAIDGTRTLENVILTSISDFLSEEEIALRKERYKKAKCSVIRSYLANEETTGVSREELEEFEKAVKAKIHMYGAKLRHPKRIHFFKKMIGNPPCDVTYRFLPQIQPENLAALNPTTGSTGPSKSAMISHRQVIGGLRQTYAWFDVRDDEIGKDIFAVFTPLYHTMAQMLGQYLCNALGGTMLFLPNPLDRNALERVIREGKPTIGFGPPRLAEAFIMLKKRGVDFSPLKLFVSGGGEREEETVKKWEKYLPEVPFPQGIGGTEYMPWACNPRYGVAKALSLGVPFSETIVRIVVKEKGRDATVGEVGEAFVSGPQMFCGYWNNHQETEKAVYMDRHGVRWLRTGDLIHKNEDGYLFFDGREKDIIVTTNGENVFPGDVEKVLRAHPSVTLATVVAARVKAGRGESIVAFVVLNEGYAPNRETKDILLAHCAGQLKEYEVPHLIPFLAQEEVPLTNKREPSRPALRELAKNSRFDSYGMLIK